MQSANYLVHVDELRNVLGESDTRIIDCRFDLTDPGAGYAAFVSAHIPGAVYADLDKDLAGPVGPGTGRHPLPDPGDMAETFARLGIDRHTRVVVYDDASGAVAARAWWLLRWLGHDNAGVLDGGFAAWRLKGMPVEEGATVAPRGKLLPRPRKELVLSTDEIVSAGDSAGALNLVDARARERFMGREEPLDKVAGHIPGSRNLPFADNLREDGQWKSAAEIRQRLTETLGPPAGQPWSVMCGSGVTACHLVIAGLLAGYSEPRVYVGSWSEWITDGTRRVASGPGEEPVTGRKIAEDS